MKEEKKEKVIRFKVTQREKERIEKAASKNGVTVSEYLRQAVGRQRSRDRPKDWYVVVSRLEEICAIAEGRVREKLVELIHTLYKGDV